MALGLLSSFEPRTAENLTHVLALTLFSGLVSREPQNTRLAKRKTRYDLNSWHCDTTLTKQWRGNTRAVISQSKLT